MKAYTFLSKVPDQALTNIINQLIRRQITRREAHELLTVHTDVSYISVCRWYNHGMPTPNRTLPGRIQPTSGDELFAQMLEDPGISQVSVDTLDRLYQVTIKGRSGDTIITEMHEYGNQIPSIQRYFRRNSVEISRGAIRYFIEDQLEP